MLAIRTEKGYLDLQEDFTMDIEDNSPVFNDRGSQSVPLTVPATPRNLMLLGNPHRPDLASDTADGTKCTVFDGVYIRTGILNVDSVSLVDGIELNIGFDNSAAYEKWKGLELRDVQLPVEEYASVTELLAHCREVLNGRTEAPYAFFQTVVREDYNEWTTNTAAKSTDRNPGVKVRKYYLRRLNNIYLERENLVMVDKARKEVYWEDSKELEVSLPQGYGVCPFLYVWYVLEKVFEHGGYTMVNNPLKEDTELARMVLLSNVADGCTGKTLRLADFLPSCTVEEFLQSLYARFGLVYEIDYGTMEVRCIFIRDAFRGAAEGLMELDGMETEVPTITAAEPKRLVLSAKTDEFEEAKVPEGSVWDFVKKGAGYIVREGTKVEKLPEGVLKAYYGKPVEAAFTAGVGYDRTLSLFSGNGDSRYWMGGYDGTSENGAFEIPVCWNYFDWDTNDEGVETEEVASEDVCFPVRFTNDVVGMLCPHFLTGYRHLYTGVTGGTTETDGESADETPLAFCFAFMKDYHRLPFGNVAPFDENGRVADGRITLLWQMEDGLFENFWKEYDAFLRHGNRKVEYRFRLAVDRLLQWRMLACKRHSGLSFLTDKLEYSLPAEHGWAVADVTLRAMSLMGRFDLAKEQAQVKIVIDKHYWTYRTEGYYNKYVDLSNYWFRRGGRVLLTSVESPANDPVLNQVPQEVGQQVEKEYRVTYEVRDGWKTDGKVITEGEFSYKAVFTAVSVPD